MKDERDLKSGPPVLRHRPYAPPRLEVLGDVRGLTLGGTVVDVGDSQFPNTRP